MNTAIILAGGVGSRMASANLPKQFLLVNERPIFTYCLTTFEQHEDIDKIVICVAETWRNYVDEWLTKLKITKAGTYADPGRTRQHSIYNGLKAASEFCGEEDAVIIHDAVRPLVSAKIISDCMLGAREEDGALPVITVKDTIYQSRDGKTIEKLLNRNELFAGQAPESFNFGQYYKIHNTVTDEEIGSTAGSSEIAFKHGMSIRLVNGSESNFKITTNEDLDTFATIISNGI